MSERESLTAARGRGMNIKVTAEASVEFDSATSMSLQRIFAGAPPDAMRYRLTIKAEGVDRDEAEAMLNGALFTLAARLPELGERNA